MDPPPAADIEVALNENIYSETRANNLLPENPNYHFENISHVSALDENGVMQMVLRYFLKISIQVLGPRSMLCQEELTALKSIVALEDIENIVGLK